MPHEIVSLVPLGDDLTINPAQISAIMRTHDNDGKVKAYIFMTGGVRLDLEMSVDEIIAKLAEYACQLV